MYGHLVQLNEDLTARATWQHVPVGSTGGEDPIDEGRLQEILFRHADLLPLGQIDPAYGDPVPVCTELGTRAGLADALYLTPTGRIILAEFKLWKNPGARREVIGQILDYARVLASWSYDDLEREVRNRTKQSPFEVVSAAHGDVQERVFVDNVARRLKRGEFLLLIVGDGIREGVEDIVSYVQEHSGLRFNLALVEAAIFRRADREDLIIQPRVLARTELLPRTVLVRRTMLEETDDDPIEEHESSPREDENERFWAAVLRDFAFDDPAPEVPQPSRDPGVGVTVEGSGFGGWGISFVAHLKRNQASIACYLTWRAGFPECERVYDEIVNAVSEDDELRRGLVGLTQWSTSNGRPRLGFQRDTEFVEEAIRDFGEAVEWMREHFNHLVSTLHPECRRRLRGRR